MPYPNEHAARIKDPGLFIPDSFRSKEIRPGVRIIVGKLKMNEGMITQAYRFDAEKFTVESAKKWLKDNRVLFKKFEPAAEESINDKNELEHVGILGMRWGVRRGDNTSGGRSANKVDKKWEKQVGKTVSGKGFTKIYNATADRMNAREISRINNKPQYKGKNIWKDKALEKKYLKEYTDTFSRVMTEEARKVVGSTNPSGTKKVTVYSDPFTLKTAFVLEDIKHAAEDQIIFLATRDENGFITNITMQKNDELIQSQEYLEHVGILGMRWGVRKDRSSGGTGNRIGGRRFLSRKKQKPGHPEHEEVSLLKKKKIRDMSNQEIEKVAKRLDLEKRYKNLNPSRTQKGKKAVGTTLSGLGKLVAFAGTATALVTTGKKIFDFVNSKKPPVTINPLTDFLKVGG